VSSHADRFAAAAQRRQDQTSGLRDFVDTLEHDLDPFQHEACRALAAGDGVLVAAPTGSGKTLIGEFGAFLALAAGQRLYYTTPIKALSNQKFREFQKRFGESRVGLLTGDRAVNADAPIIVMTTEILRNMLYSAVGVHEDVAFVVMDEVHYLADRTRGAVWEEVIIHLPQRVRVIALSATVSNAEEFGAWLQATRGRVHVVVEEHRPIPLSQAVVIDGELHALFDRSGGVSQSLIARTRRAQVEQWRPGQRPGTHQGRGPRGGHRQSRTEVLEALELESLLPTIDFIFSRAGCEAALAQCRAAGLRLTTPQERVQIRGIVDAMSEVLPEEDLAILGWPQWRDSLEDGVAAHHAGLIPLFKEVVERLFQEGLLKVVFATETLALGINMPARSVVIERLVKWNGEQHAPLSAGEYTQLTGRAGRRGLDREGTAIVPWSPDLDVQALAGLASARTYPLNSSFRPTYNMAVNLLTRFGAEQSVALLERSFAQFQVEQRLRNLNEQLGAAQENAEELQSRATCHLGDFDEYFELRSRLSANERAVSRRTSSSERAAVNVALEQLGRGDVVYVDRGRNTGFVVILDNGKHAAETAVRPLVLGTDRRLRRVSATDFASPPHAMSQMKISGAFSARKPESRKRLAAELRTRTADLTAPRPSRPVVEGDAEVARLRREIRAHPCHGCDEREDHARWAQLRARALQESSAIQARIGQRASTLGKQFERVCLVLAEMGYVTRGEVLKTTDEGRRLAGIYADLDLLSAECVRHGVLDGLESHELVALAALLVFEAREDDDYAGEPISAPGLRRAMVAAYDAWQDINEVEQRFRVSTQRTLHAGFVRPALRWARGDSLAAVLASTQLQPGDFVRWCRQVIDWLVQVSEVLPEGSVVRSTCRQAVDLVDRDIVQLMSQ